MKKENKAIIYQAKNGAIELRGDFSRQTAWATQAQMADIFGVNPQAVTKHLKNIYKEKELEEVSTCSKVEQVQIEGNRKIIRSINFYNLDAIISVGYRINSQTGTKFRQWATKILKSYITDGFVINRKLIAKNHERFLSMVEDVKQLLPEGSGLNPKDATELISVFADTWLSLDAYDKEKLSPRGKLTKKKVDLTAEKISIDLKKFKYELTERKEATDIFGQERSRGVVAGIVGNVMQTFGGQELYPTVEEKAAHLLYFMVKNHPFVDGNKRSGAFAFVWFLKQMNLLNIKKLTPSALTALTVLVAESNPEHKERIIKLILNLIV